MELYIDKTCLEIMEGDITNIESEAIVNAANSHLLHGGGVAAAIARKGGDVIQRESTRWVGEYGPVPAGSAAITSAGNLPARYVIHTVGPRMGEGSEDEKLKKATWNSLKLAEEYKLKSIVFPAISTGIFGFPLQRCAQIMLDTAIGFVKKGTSLKSIRFCLYGGEAFSVFENVFQQFGNPC